MNLTQKFIRLVGALGATLLAFISLPATVSAADKVLEEIIVTARQTEETLQDVPVTIAAFTEEDLDRYNIINLVDAGKMVPNMVIAQGGSGNGSSLRLRGIGSSSISAAFDHSVAINIDGVVVNRGRFIHNSYLDMSQLEVLKGPQSLYFGKSATAGVISITTNDPGDEFEFQIAAGVETEHDGTTTEMVISGPLTDTFGARFAVGTTENDEMMENYSFDHDPQAAVNGADKWFGDESFNARLTLVWEPTDNFKAKLKYSYSEYDSSGGNMWSEEFCPEGAHQPTGVPSASAPFRIFQGVDDCKLNGNASKIYLDPGLKGGLPWGYDDGKARLEQETDFVSITADWDINDTYNLTAVTGIINLEHYELDDYSYGAGVFGGLHNNVYESVSQEFRLSSNYDGPLNFMLGLYWQDVEQEFDAHQYAFNLGVMPNIFGPAYALVGGDPTAAIIGPDPVTGKSYDYNKDHFLDTKVVSYFLALYWDLNDRTEITAGARYTDEEKEGHIRVPYMHAAAALFGWGVPELIDGLDFDDSNVSPEFAINYHWTDDISVFFAYKEGFKSGGVDNSALPTAALNPNSPTFDGFGFLFYDSEEADGFEIGTKATLLDGAMRLNATMYSYEYSDLQVQLFDSSIIQFSTFNASSMEAQGFEFDVLWQTNIDGLTVRSAWAWNDVEYTGDFINATGENLKGQKGGGTADIAGYIGMTLDRSIATNWRVSFSVDARYSDEFPMSATANPFVQDSFWLLDTAISVYTEDGRHQFNLIGRNVNDEIYSIGSGAIPGRCANYDGACNPTGANDLDQSNSTQLGRTITLQYRFTL